MSLNHVIKNVLLAFFIMLLAIVGFSQETGKQKVFKEIIPEIEKKYNVRFSYNAELLDTLKLPEIDYNIPLDSLLNQIELELESKVKFEKLNSRFITVKWDDLKKKETEKLVLISGTITDSLNNTPLSFASVQVLNNVIGTITDENGFFELKINPGKVDSIAIQFLGYKTRFLEIQQLIDNPGLTIFLTPTVNELKEVVIREYITKGIEINEESDEIILTTQRMKMTPGMAENDVFHMVQILPGVNSVSESVSNINIRGGTPDQNLILWEGITQYSSGHFFGLISSFNQGATQKVTIQKDHFNSEFGGRSAGVIQIQGLNKVPESVKGSVGLNLMHSDATLQAPVGNKLAFFISGRRSYFDIIKNGAYTKLSDRAFQDTRYDTELSGLKEDMYIVYSDISSKILYEGEKANFSISAYKINNQLRFNNEYEEQEEYFDEEDDDEVSYTYDIFTNDEIELENFGYSAKLSLKVIKNINNSFYFGFTEYQTKSYANINTENNEDFERRLVNNLVEDLSFRQINSTKLFSKDSLQFGYELKQLKTKHSINYESTFDEDYNEEVDVVPQSYHSLFFQYSFPLGKLINANLGYRYTFKNEMTAPFSEPRIMLGVKLGKNTMYRVRAGLYSQYMNQIIDFNDAGLTEKVWKITDNEDDEKILSRNFSTGLLYSSNGFQVELDGYFKKVSGLNTMSLTFSGTNERDIFEPADSRTIGLDFMVKRRVGRFNLWGSYTLSKTTLLLNEYDEDETIEISAPHDQRHKTDLSVQYKFKRFELISSWHYKSGKPYTQANGVLHLTEEDEDNFEIIYGDMNSSRLPDYHRLDLSVLYTVPISGRVNSKFGVSALNLYNRQNALNVSYFIDEEEEGAELIENNSYLMQRLINLSIRIEW